MDVETISSDQAGISLAEPIASERKVVIKPTRAWASLQLWAVWEYRELLYFLVWRDLKTRYTNSVLGLVWLVLYPLFAVMIYTLIFSRLLKAPSDGIPYPIFIFAGLHATAKPREHHTRQATHPQHFVGSVITLFFFNITKPPLFYLPHPCTC